MRWRLLEDGPGAASWNMALDEALLECHREGDPPLLRLYRWSPAAISLGRFQPAADVAPPPGVDLVRRISGGAALYHQPDEVTYAVVAPYALLGRRPRAAYHAIHGALKRALVALGVERSALRGGHEERAPLRGMCFDHATPEDLTLDGRKLLGSAQRRAGRAFLQHGALPLSPDPLARGATSLREVVGAGVAPEAVRAAIRAAFSEALGADLAPDAPSPGELALARRLEAERYAQQAWTQAR